MGSVPETLSADLIERWTSFSSPFPHFVTPSVFPPSICARLYSWFESTAPWELVEKDFYEQYEFCLMSHELPDTLSSLKSVDSLNYLRRIMSAFSGYTLREDTEVTAHKLVPGQTIRIHNDHLTGSPTCRLIAHLSPRWHESFGGRLMLFNSSNASDVNKIVNPHENSGFGFVVSASSHHAISTIHASIRYSVVFTFSALDGV